MMTAPLRAGEITVPVALGARAYDISIGRGLIAEYDELRRVQNLAAYRDTKLRKITR